MSYDPNDYNGHDPEREECKAWEREQDAYDERLQAFDAGLCSHSAAVSGGAKYRCVRELAETAIELKEAGRAIPMPIPVAAASVARTSAKPRKERSAA